MDWADIAIHAGVSLGAVALAGLAGLHWYAAVAFTGFWIGREAGQAFGKYGHRVPLQDWSKQKLMEGFSPAGPALATAIVVWLWRV